MPSTLRCPRKSVAVRNFSRSVPNSLVACCRYHCEKAWSSLALAGGCGCAGGGEDDAGASSSSGADAEGGWSSTTSCRLGLRFVGPDGGGGEFASDPDSTDEDSGEDSSDETSVLALRFRLRFCALSIFCAGIVTAQAADFEGLLLCVSIYSCEREVRLRSNSQRPQAGLGTSFSHMIRHKKTSNPTHEQI